MVRYPEKERQSLGNLENMRIRTSENIEVPFSTVAKVIYGDGFSAINRENQQRVIDVKGDVNRSIVTPEEIMAAVEKAVCAKGTSFGSPGKPMLQCRIPLASHLISPVNSKSVTGHSVA